MKTPLRYPGGKSRAVKTLMEFIPEDCGELCSPFLGGGSFELALAEKGITVHGYDGFKPIVWFWKALLKDPKRLAAWVDMYRRRKTYHYKAPRATEIKKIRAWGLSKKDFERFREEIRFALRENHPFTLEAAAKVYAINRSSFSGGTFGGGFSERASYARFTDQQIEYIRNFKIDNLTVNHADFKHSMKKHDCFFYLDPPYFLEGDRSKLYGDHGDMHECFPHLALFSTLRKRDNWILSYNDCEEIRSLYRDYKIHEAEWTYGMNKSKKSSEIIITNLTNGSN
tara:strand:- start:729 stop:1577 length:849 start_codon:yes stop_codon:yes gene_type:complete